MDPLKLGLILAAIGVIGVPVTILGVILMIRYYKRQKKQSASFEKRVFGEIDKIKQKLGVEPYVDGIPQITDKSKQKAFESALKAFNSNQFDTSIQLFQEYLQKFQVTESERCAILNFIGLVQNTRGFNEESLNTFTEMKLGAETIKDNDALKIAWGQLGIIYHDLSDLKKSLECHNKALKISKNLKNERYIAADLCNIGLVYHNRGRLSSAMRRP